MWLFIPSDETLRPSVYAPEPEALTSHLTLPFLDCVRSYMWRGKPSPLRIWLQRCRRDFWLRRLFGMMPEQSQADAFVASSIWSLAASRASRTALPAAALAPPTGATSGQPCGASLSSPAPGASISRTSAGCSAGRGARGFGETYADWVSRLRADFSRRRKSAEPTSGNASSSSPSTLDDPPSLEFWPTPTERDHRSVHAGPDTLNKNSRPLSERAGLWQTPTVADVTGGHKSRSGRRKAELLLPGQAQALSHHLDPTTPSDGAAPSPSGLILNPWFVEWLMDWPEGWTTLAIQRGSNGPAFSAMAFCRWRRRTRSELSRIALAPEPEPAQLDFFA